MVKVNDRVGCIFGGKDKTIKFLGYGVYLGDHVPDNDAAGFIAEALRDKKIENPKIKLDNDSIVWGCECWWGPEDVVKKNIEHFKSKGITVVEINIKDERKKYDNSRNDKSSS